MNIILLRRMIVVLWPVFSSIPGDPEISVPGNPSTKRNRVFLFVFADCSC